MVPAAPRLAAGPVPSRTAQASSGSSLSLRNGPQFARLSVDQRHSRPVSELQRCEVGVFDCLEVFYNQRRRHSTLGQLSPAAFERHAAAQGADAAVPVDAQNAPTRDLENCTERSFPRAPTPVIVRICEEGKKKRSTLTNLSTIRIRSNLRYLRHLQMVFRICVSASSADALGI
jgi:hypothetical protein